MHARLVDSHDVVDARERGEAPLLVSRAGGRIVHDADDGERRDVAQIAANRDQAPADRIGAAPQPACQAAADDDGAFVESGVLAVRRAAFGCVEVAAAHEREAHEREVAGRRRDPANLLRRRQLQPGHGVGRMDLDVEGIDALLPHGACDAGHGRESLLQADERSLALLVERAVARVDVEAQLEDAIGVRLRRQLPQVRAHLQHQRPHGQQRGLREGDLRDHQPGLEPQASRDHDAGRVLQRLLQPRPEWRAAPARIRTAHRRRAPGRT